MPINGATSRQVNFAGLCTSQDRATQLHKEIFTVTLKARSSVDSIISVIVKTVFVLMLLFDIRKVCRTKIFTKK